MKKILYLTFYFEPDLCAGSFRNTPLAKELAKQVNGKAMIDVVTTMPNRYSSFEAEALKDEVTDNLKIKRVVIPKHQSGMKDQIFSFKAYYAGVKEFIKGKDYDLVIASSSRLFTAYLGYKVAKSFKAPLYLDIRDIFYDTLEDVLKDGILKKLAMPVIKAIERKTFNYATHINLISGGFKSYFNDYKNVNFSFYPNGIDDIFIEENKKNIPIATHDGIKLIVYAGNIGEGQGLHKIIPKVAKAMEGKMKFLVIGDGGAKQKLKDQLNLLNVQNVDLKDPVKRNELVEIYRNADFLFAHLNNYKAFEKVLPSKLFELATFPKPIIAGVGGFAADFVRNNIENAILFEPCNVDQLVKKLELYSYCQINRTAFVNQFKRDTVNKEMAATILNYV